MTEGDRPDRGDDLDAAFMRLYLTHQRQIYAHLRTLLHNAADAADLFQETSIILWGKRGEYRPELSFIAWAAGIAYQVVRNFRAKQSRGRIRFDDELLARISTRAEEMRPELDARREALDQCLKKLRPRDSDLVERRYQPGATIKSVAADVGRPVEGLYKAMRRIHEALAECVARAMRGEGERT